MDIDQSIKSNTLKEVKEESGLDVEAVRIIAIQDRKLQNKPKYAYGVCKIFVECKLLGGSFVPNLETSEMAFFTFDNLPELAEAKNGNQPKPISIKDVAFRTSFGLGPEKTENQGPNRERKAGNGENRWC